jgi:hypothetical protein
MTNGSSSPAARHVPQANEICSSRYLHVFVHVSSRLSSVVYSADIPGLKAWEQCSITHGPNCLHTAATCTLLTFRLLIPRDRGVGIDSASRQP